MSLNIQQLREQLGAKAEGLKDQEVVNLAKKEGVLSEQEAKDLNNTLSNEKGLLAGDEVHFSTGEKVAAGVAAGIGVGILAFLTRGKGIKGALKALGLATGVAVGAGALSSCTVDVRDEASSVAQMDVSITQLEQSKDYTEFFNTLIKNLDAFKEQFDKVMDILIKLSTNTAQILEVLTVLGKSVEDFAANVAGDNKEIKALLTQILSVAQEGKNIGENNNKILSAILSKLGTLDKNDQNTQEILRTILAKINELITQGKDADDKTIALLTAILGKVDNFSEENKAGILAILEKLNNLPQTDSKKFDEIIAKLAILINQGEGSNALLTKILAKINELIEKGDKANDKTIALLTAILEGVNEGNENNKELLLAILEKVDTFSEENKAGILAILEKLNNLPQTDSKKFDEIIAKLTVLINQGDKSNAFLSQILEKINELISKGDEADARVIAALNKLIELVTAGNVKLDVITGLLEKIKNNQVTTADLKAFLEANNEDMKEFLTNMFNMLIVNFNIENEKVLAKLQEILEKIPPECNHDAIIAKLEIIIKYMKEGNNEGVLDDLDDLFK